MAVVIFGGLLTSTVLNLLVMPSLYLRWGRRPPSAPMRSAQDSLNEGSPPR